MSEFIKVKDRYIRKSEVVSFSHDSHTKIPHQSSTEFLLIRLRGGEHITQVGPKTLLGQFAKHFETPTQDGNVKILCGKCSKELHFMGQDEYRP